MFLKINQIIEKIPNNTSFKAIIDYIMKEYHAPARKILPELDKKISSLTKKYGEKFPEFIQIYELFKQFEMLFIKHINIEEDVLFPKILELEKFQKSKTKVSVEEFISVEIAIKRQNIEHEEFEIYWASFLGLLLNSKMETEHIEEYFDLALELEGFRNKCIEHSKIESFHLDLLVMNSKANLI